VNAKAADAPQETRSKPQSDHSHVSDHSHLHNSAYGSPQSRPWQQSEKPGGAGKTPTELTFSHDELYKSVNDTGIRSPNSGTQVASNDSRFAPANKSTEPSGGSITRAPDKVAASSGDASVAPPKSPENSGTPSDKGTQPKDVKPTVPDEARDLNPKMTPYTVKPGDTLDSITNAQIPDGSAWQKQAYGAALQQANGLGDRDQPLPDQLKLPEVRDGSVISQRGDTTLKVNQDHSFSLFDKSDGTGIGRDSNGKTYASRKLPDGSIERGYPNGSSQIIKADGSGGTGVDSHLRDYDFSYRDGGGEDRTYKDNGAQMRVNSDGSSIYKGLDPKKPKDGPVFEMRDSQGDTTYRKPLTKAENAQSMDDTIRNQAIDLVANGALIPPETGRKGSTAGTELLRAAAKNDYTKAGGGENGDNAVKKLLSDIQKQQHSTPARTNPRLELYRDKGDGYSIPYARQYFNWHGQHQRSDTPLDLEPR